MKLINKIRRILNGNWIDDMFTFSSSSTDVVQPDSLERHAKDCPYKVERFEGDCY